MSRLMGDDVQTPLTLSPPDPARQNRWGLGGGARPKDMEALGRVSGLPRPSDHLEIPTLIA